MFIDTKWRWTFLSDTHNDLCWLGISGLSFRLPGREREREGEGDSEEEKMANHM